MRDEGAFTWMLESKATVVSTDLLGRTGISCNYILHFWDSGEVKIISTDHPMVIDVPHDDITELKKWCDDCGWSRLTVSERLLDSIEGFQFWMRMYISGLIYSDELKKHEEDNMKRLIQAQNIEGQEDANQSSINI